MHIALIVAAATNHTIGRDNKLPWHLPNDLRFFKAMTMGKPIVMGRKTWESLGKPLPGRSNIVITTQHDYTAPGAQIFHTVDDALRAASDIAQRDGVDEVMIIGGETIYRESIDQADRIYLTRVHAEIEGDAIFPALDLSQWREVSREDHAACERNPYAYSMLVFERV